jgi:hypothetical protein
MAQISTAAHQSISSNKCKVIALSFIHFHFAVFRAAYPFIKSQITAKISIQIEFISFGSENLSIEFFIIKTLPITSINTVINAPKMEYLAYP